MLSELRIKNFAIIENLDVSFQRGMNILSGETGAGKSIIIKAVNLLLGDRAVSGIVRSGEDEAVVEALFTLAGNSRLISQLKDLGIECEEDIVLRRVISREGKNRVFINGSLATLTMLAHVAEGLISISSQHEHQTLLKPERHLFLLDRYGKLEKKRALYNVALGKYLDVKDQLGLAHEDEKRRSSRKELLEFQLDEIDKADLKPHEDEALLEERNILSNAEKLAGAASSAEEVIYSSEDSIVEKLGSVVSSLKGCGPVDPALNNLALELEDILFKLEDAGAQFRSYGDRITFDPVRLDWAEARLARIEVLKKKYGPALKDVLNLRDSTASELGSLEEFDTKRHDLEKALSKLKDEALKLGAELTISRREAAERLSHDIEKEMADVSMTGSRFEVVFTPHSEKGSGNAEVMKEGGLDAVEFYISTNPGERLKPISKVASGGELSRIMLALKSCILADDC